MRTRLTESAGAFAEVGRNRELRKLQQELQDALSRGAQLNPEARLLPAVPGGLGLVAGRTNPAGGNDSARRTPACGRKTSS